MEGQTAVNDAPATFEAAFAADASPAPATPEQTTTPSAAEQPTTAQEQPQQSDEREPFIPRQRFDEVNTERNTLKQWKEQYAWAEQLGQEQFAQMVEWYQRAHENPLTFTTDLVAQLQNDPTYGPQLRSLAAKTLAQGRGQQQTDLDSLIIDLGNGQTLAMKDLKAQLLEEARREFEPVTKTIEQINLERAQAQAHSYATTTLTEARKDWTQFKEHEPEIKAKLSSMKLPNDAGPELVSLALRAAYAEVVLPKLQQSTAQAAQSELLDNLQRKAAASSVNPGNAAAASPRRVDSFNDPSLKW